MAPEHIEKTSFVYHRGKYEFVGMPFGVRNAPVVFQALMTRLLSDCKNFCSPYMDDIVIFSRDRQEHRIHVRQVLQKLKEAGLMANPAKCHWGGGQRWSSWGTWLGKVVCPYLATEYKPWLSTPSQL